MITINGQKESVTCLTKVEEITPEVLTELTKGIKLAEHYAIIAIITKSKVFDLTMLSKTKDATISVIPKLAKLNSNNSEFSIGETIVIDRSSLERGYHVNFKHKYSVGSITNFFANNEEERKKLMIGENPLRSTEIYAIQFKIVPINQIVATIISKN